MPDDIRDNGDRIVYALNFLGTMGYRKLNEMTAQLHNCQEESRKVPQLSSHKHVFTKQPCDMSYISDTNVCQHSILYESVKLSSLKNFVCVHVLFF